MRSQELKRIFAASISVDSTVQEIENEIDDIISQMDEKESLVDTLTAEVGELNSKINSLNEDLARAGSASMSEEELIRFKEDLEKSLAETNADLQGKLAKQDKINLEYNELKERLSAISKISNQMTAKNDKFSKEIKENNSEDLKAVEQIIYKDLSVNFTKIKKDGERLNILNDILKEYWRENPQDFVKKDANRTFKNFITVISYIASALKLKDYINIDKNSTTPNLCDIIGVSCSLIISESKIDLDTFDKYLKKFDIPKADEEAILAILNGRRGSFVFEYAKSLSDGLGFDKISELDKKVFKKEDIGAIQESISEPQDEVLFDEESEEQSAQNNESEAKLNLDTIKVTKDDFGLFNSRAYVEKIKLIRENVKKDIEDYNFFDDPPRKSKSELINIAVKIIADAWISKFFSKDDVEFEISKYSKDILENLSNSTDIKSILYNALKGFSGCGDSENLCLVFISNLTVKSWNQCMRELRIDDLKNNAEEVLSRKKEFEGQRQNAEEMKKLEGVTIQDVRNFKERIKSKVFESIPYKRYEFLSISYHAVMLAFGPKDRVAFSKASNDDILKSILKIIKIDPKVAEKIINTIFDSIKNDAELEKYYIGEKFLISNRKGYNPDVEYTKFNYLDNKTDFHKKLDVFKNSILDALKSKDLISSMEKVDDEKQTVYNLIKDNDFVSDQIESVIVESSNLITEKFKNPDTRNIDDAIFKNCSLFFGNISSYWVLSSFAKAIDKKLNKYENNFYSYDKLVTLSRLRSIFMGIANDDYEDANTKIELVFKSYRDAIELGWPNFGIETLFEGMFTEANFDLFYSEILNKIDSSTFSKINSSLGEIVSKEEVKSEAVTIISEIEDFISSKIDDEADKLEQEAENAAKAEKDRESEKIEEKKRKRKEFFRKLNPLSYFGKNKRDSERSNDEEDSDDWIDDSDAEIVNLWEEESEE
jgi:hypothetical protein